MASRTSVQASLMMEAVRTSETSVDNHFTRQYIPEDNSEQHFPFPRNSMYNKQTNKFQTKVSLFPKQAAF
jgi:hypothetical protein